MFPKFVFNALAEELLAQHVTNMTKRNKTLSIEVYFIALLSLRLQEIISKLDYYWEDVLYKSIALGMFFKYAKLNVE